MFIIFLRWLWWCFSGCTRLSGCSVDDAALRCTRYCRNIWFRTLSAFSALSDDCASRSAIDHVCTVSAVAAFDAAALKYGYGDVALDTHTAVTAVLTAVIFRICAAAAENLCVFAYDDLGIGRCVRLRCGFYACCAVHAVHACNAVSALNRTVYDGQSRTRIARCVCIFYESQSRRCALCCTSCAAILSGSSGFAVFSSDSISISRIFCVCAAILTSCAASLSVRASIAVFLAAICCRFRDCVCAFNGMSYYVERHVFPSVRNRNSSLDILF